MSDLFSKGFEDKLLANSPLAFKARPSALSDFIGQKHILGEGKMLRKIIESNHLTSLLFFGPPGCGKSTLAKIIASQVQAEFIQINAVTSSVSDIRKIVEDAKTNLSFSNRRTLVFIDEIHRFNKSQQDSLLPAVESGVITLIGATTFNPYFYVTPALLSRLHVFELKNLTETEMKEMVIHALKNVYNKSADIDEKAFLRLLDNCSRDGRRMLNLCEIAVETGLVTGDPLMFTAPVIEKLLQKAAVDYNRDDEHYDVISAFIKSVRASEPDAALHYLARMIEGGEDIRFIARRLVILASEDIGNANPMSIVVAQNIFDGVEKIGMPEAAILLAQATTYLASSPKSNASCMALMKARADVASGFIYKVPDYLRDSHYSSTEKIGRGEGYQYPHNFPGHVIHNNSKNYQPYCNREYYIPSEVGAEKKIKEYLYWKRTAKRYDRPETEKEN